MSLAELRLFIHQRFGVRSFSLIGYTANGHFFATRKERHMLNVAVFATNGELNVQVVGRARTSAAHRTARHFAYRTAHAHSAPDA